MRVRHLTLEQSLDHAPDPGDPGDGERRPRKAVERHLRAPRCGCVRVERGGETGLVRGQTLGRAFSGQDRFGRELGRDERLVDPVAGEWIDEPRGVAHEQRSARRGRRAHAPHRQPVAANPDEPFGREAVRLAQPRQVFADPGAFSRPAPDADVDVVALREEPAVAARYDTELDQREIAGRGRIEVSVGRVTLECDAAMNVERNARETSGGAVRAVRSDEHIRPDTVAADGRHHAVRSHRQGSGRDPVSKIGARSHRLLGEEGIEPPPLRHPDERHPVSPLEALPVAKPDREAHDVGLDRGGDVARRMTKRPAGQPAAARLVAREALAVEEQHARTAPREPDRGRRARRPSAKHEGVVTAHAATLPRSGRGSRVAKGGGL